MLSPRLVAAVEGDVTVARQLAYFHIGYSPDGQDMEVEPEQFMSGALPDSLSTAHAPAVNAATHIRVAMSNPVQRPRQGTCAVLMELTRPLVWLSCRGRHRGSASSTVAPTAGNAGATGRPVSNASIASGHVGGGAEASATGGTSGTLHHAMVSAVHRTGCNSNGNGINPNMNASATASSVASVAAAAASSSPSGSASAATSGLSPGSVNASSCGVGTASKASAASTLVSPPFVSGAPRSANTSVVAGTGHALPLLVATVTAEVVFPARYPLEPCEWHLSEEASAGGVSDQSTSSWAVTTGPRSHSTRGSGGARVSGAGPSLTRGAEGLSSAASASSFGMEEGVPRRPISTRLLAAAGGENAMKGNNDDGSLGVGAAGEESARLTAAVAPALGRRLLRWMAEARRLHNGAVLSASGNPATSANQHTCRNNASPFLLDFACLLRCWSAVELDVHHLLLPSRIALAYSRGGVGGGGVRLLRTMAGTHLSAGGGGAVNSSSTAAAASGAAVAATTSAQTGVGGVVPGSANTVGVGSNSNVTNPSVGGNGVNHHATASAAGLVERARAVYKGPGNAVVAGTVGAAAATGSMSSTSSEGNPLGGNSGGNTAIGSAAGGMPVGTSSNATVPTNIGITASGTSTALTGGTGGGPTASAGTGASALYPYRRRAVKHFLAVLLPQGDVAVCGIVSSAAAVGARRGGGGSGAVVGAGPASVAPNSATKPGPAAAVVRLGHVPDCLLPLYEAAKRSADREAWAKQQQPQQQQPLPPEQQQRRPAALPGTLLGCTSQFVRGTVLPSYLLPSHILGSLYRCEWDDVRVFTSKSPGAALHANAKLAKALHLPDVSDLLQVLRRLTKNVGTSSTGKLYIGEVIWPTLMETVRVLRSARLPFWAGLAVCSLLLPSVLEQEEEQQHDAGKVSSGMSRRATVCSIGVLPAVSSTAEGGTGGVDVAAAAVRRLRQDFAEMIQVVTYVERVLAVAREYTLLCETRLVRCALQRGQQQLLPQGCAKRGEQEHESSGSATSACVLPEPPVQMCRRLHAPISVCAVCGLSLLRNTVKHGAAAGGGTGSGVSGGESKELGQTSATASPAAKHSSEYPTSKGTHVDPVSAATAGETRPMGSASLQTRCAEGCLVVQCARCGHGGHVEHMSSWWNDPTVHCCPKGCDCICEY
jgi:hypothetical protein